MSKNLVKILSICAFVIILPLAILATALCVTESASYKLKLYIAGIDANNHVANCKVLINGEERKNNELTVAKNSEVVVTFEGEGYDFGAWYNGSEKVITENDKLSDNVTYTVKMTKNTSLTAKCSVKSYRVSYTGNDEDGNPLNLNNVVEYKYGDKLMVLEGQVNFVGWVLKGTPTVYKTATFEKSGDIILEAFWANNKSVSYYNGDKVIYSKIYTQEEFNALELIGADSEIVKNNVGKGYEFTGWVDANGEPFDLSAFKGEKYETSAKEVKINLARKAIKYTVNVKVNPNTDGVIAITYDVENGFSEFKVPTRTNYTFEGIKIGDKVYKFVETEVPVENAPATQADEETTEPSEPETPEVPAEPEQPTTKKVYNFVCGEEKLGDVLINGTQTTVEGSCVWVAEVSQMNITFRGSDFNATKSVYGRANEEYRSIGTVEIPFKFNDQDGLDLTDSVYETFVNRYHYDGFFFREGNVSEGYTYQEVSLTEIRIYSGNKSVATRLDNLTTYDFAGMISDFVKAEENVNGVSITVTFIFG